MGDDIVEISTENDASKNKIDSDHQQCLGEFKAKLLKQINNDKRGNLIMSRLKKQIEKPWKMAFFSSNKLWESEIDIIVSKRNKLKDLKIYQLKLQIQDS